MDVVGERRPGVERHHAVVPSVTTSSATAVLGSIRADALVVRDPREEDDGHADQGRTRCAGAGGHDGVRLVEGDAGWSEGLSHRALPRGYRSRSPVAAGF